MGKVGVVLPGSFTDAGAFLADARALEAAGVDSIWIQTSGLSLDPWLLLAAAAAVTSRVRLGVLLVDAGRIGRGGRQLETLNWLSRSRALWGVTRGREVQVAKQPNEPAEPWFMLPAGDREALASARDTETSVLVPMSPGLLDLLRRPDQADDRSDLVLSQG